MRRAVLATAIIALTIAGCGKEDGMESDKQVQERAVALRTHIDDLAERVGTAPQVVQDEVGDCVPGDEDSGSEPTYTVHVTVDEGTADRLRGEIAEHFDARGWQVKHDPVDPGDREVTVRFAKGPFTMGASVNETAGRASVGGSGGCVR